MDIGLPEKVRKKIAAKLEIFLASTYALYLKTQNFHWNIVGPEFSSLHLLFEKHYEEMAEAVDEIAERVRALGFFVDASFASFQKKSKIQGGKAEESSKKMLKELAEDHEALSRQGRPLISETQELHDDITSDLLIKRLAFHEKAGWMLRSHLQ